jgi:peptide/nickel transport system permease protein
MIRTALRLAAGQALTLLVLSVLAFALPRAAPGDPAAILLRGAGDEPSPEAVAALRAQLGLDRSPPQQYLLWLGRAVRGDLGVSFASRQPVAGEFFARLPATLQLAGAAALLTAVLGGGGGFLAALRRGGWPDRLTWLLALAGASLPAYWLGLLLGWVFGVLLGWLPVAGSGSWRHLVLPALTLALGFAALQIRLLRAGLLGALAEPFALTARAKGLSPGGVLWRHALPRAAGPAVQALGLAAAQMLAGAVVVETVFAWPGVGKLAVDSIARRDYPVVQAYVLIVGTVFVLVNLATDLVHAAVDPTARAGLSGREPVA